MKKADFPGEVVTRALVRYVEVPGLSGEIALVTLDNGHDHTRPSTFGPAGLAALDRALDEVEAHSPRVAAIAVTGKPFIFAVGADLGGVPLIPDRAAALELGRLGHRVFRRLHDSAVPTFAFVNGAAMGGGLELALHCGHRTLSRSAAALALPEVFLGLVPGWGGTQLLPRLVGAAAAVTVMIDNPLNQNRMLKPEQAAALGLADVLLDGADFLAESLRWAARVVRGEVAVSRPEVDRGPAWAEAVARGRALADAKVHGAAPAAYRALELIELARTADLDAGFAAEDEALADLVMGDELRAGLYAFDLVQKRARRPVGAPAKELARPVTKVGVVGAGLMAGQLALLFARRLEVPVVLTDLDQARLDKGVAYVHAEVDTLLRKKRVGPDQANRLKALVTGSLTKDAFADADLVIEAVFEELKVKQQVFAEVEAVVRPDCVLATNTSSLPVTEMAAGLAHPERVVGLHFFNPVAVLPLLEVVRAERTDDATLATAFAVGKQLKKSCVLVRDAPALRGQPAAHPLPRRGHRGGGRGHAGGGGRPGAGAAGPADVAVRAARAGRPGGRAAHRGDAARGLAGPVPAQRQPRPAGRGGQAGAAQLGAGRAGGGPGGAGAVRGRRPAVHRGAGAGAGAGRAGRGGAAAARRGRGGRAAGRRPVHAAGRRLAVPPRRHHAVPGPGRGDRAGDRPPLPPAGSRQPALGP